MSWGPSRIREASVTTQPMLGSTDTLVSYRNFSSTISAIRKETSALHLPTGKPSTPGPSPVIALTDVMLNRKKTTRPIHESDKLIKQTFSVYVSLPEDHPHEITRKWHLSMCLSLLVSHACVLNLAQPLTSINVQSTVWVKSTIFPTWAASTCRRTFFAARVP